MEVCNGVDDDCDGVADNGLGVTTCGLGACARTVSNCVAGMTQVCAPGSPGVEVCNGVDDNCNGLVDEGGVCAPPADSGVVMCAPGTADCDALAANGCETNVASDAHNCGACGASCASGQACVAGVCR
jgi:hypothetical protein